MAGSLGLPQPYAGKVTSLRHLTGELTTEITVLTEVIAGRLDGAAATWRSSIRLASARSWRRSSPPRSVM